ncbi:MAG: HAD-IIA family hydrolase, partial [Acidimicrobiia bacterium]
MNGPGGGEARGVGLALCDLDGVVWLGGDALPGAAAGVHRLRQGGYRVVFVTNNSSLTNAEILARLDRAGIVAAPDEVLSSAIAAARLIRSEPAAGARVLACAGAGVLEALAGEGLEAVEEGPCQAVIVGWHRTFDFERLDRAAAAVRAGARFVATNLDPTFPAPGRLLPGNGALVAAVATAA